jgi:DNA-binding response OmpR family regulator
VLTTSGALADVNRAYELGANSFVVKSLDMLEFVAQLKELKRHWL